jgi:hypothetical protein
MRDPRHTPLRADGLCLVPPEVHRESLQLALQDVETTADVDPLTRNISLQTLRLHLETCISCVAFADTVQWCCEWDEELRVVRRVTPLSPTGEERAPPGRSLLERITRDTALSCLDVLHSFHHFLSSSALPIPPQLPCREIASSLLSCLSFALPPDDLYQCLECGFHLSEASRKTDVTLREVWDAIILSPVEWVSALETTLSLLSSSPPSRFRLHLEKYCLRVLLQIARRRSLSCGYVFSTRESRRQTLSRLMQHLSPPLVVRLTCDFLSLQGDVSYLVAHGLMSLLSSPLVETLLSSVIRGLPNGYYKALVLYETIERLSHDSLHRDVFVRVFVDTMMQLPSRVDTDALEDLLDAIEKTTPCSLLSAFEGLLQGVGHSLSEQTDERINLHEKEVTLQRVLRALRRPPSPPPSFSCSPRSPSLLQHVHPVVGEWLDVFAIDPSLAKNHLLAMRESPRGREAIECLTESLEASRETLGHSTHRMWSRLWSSLCRWDLTDTHALALRPIPREMVEYVEGVDRLSLLRLETDLRQFLEESPPGDLSALTHWLLDTLLGPLSSSKRHVLMEVLHLHKEWLMEDVVQEMLECPSGDLEVFREVSFGCIELFPHLPWTDIALSLLRVSYTLIEGESGVLRGVVREALCRVPHPLPLDVRCAISHLCVLRQIPSGDWLEHLTHPTHSEGGRHVLVSGDTQSSRMLDLLGPCSGGVGELDLVFLDFQTWLSEMSLRGLSCASSDEAVEYYRQHVLYVYLPFQFHRQLDVFLSAWMDGWMQQLLKEPSLALPSPLVDLFRVLTVRMITERGSQAWLSLLLPLGKHSAHAAYVDTLASLQRLMPPWRFDLSKGFEESWGLLRGLLSLECWSINRGLREALCVGIGTLFVQVRVEGTLARDVMSREVGEWISPSMQESLSSNRQLLRTLREVGDGIDHEGMDRYIDLLLSCKAQRVSDLLPGAAKKPLHRVLLEKEKRRSPRKGLDVNVHLPQVRWKKRKEPPPSQIMARRLRSRPDRTI